MSSRALYDRIHDASRARLASGDVQTDDFLSGKKRGVRLGISLIIPSGAVREAYGKLAAAARVLDPGQYVYPAEDLHITVFDFIQGREGYVPEADAERAFTVLSEEVLGAFGPFAIRLDGLAASAAAALIQGYDGGVLTAMRAAIRRALAQRGLPNDERYASESAHVTFLRFARPLSDPASFSRFIADNREAPFGTVTVNTLDLVEHDWFNQSATRRVLATFRLSAARTRLDASR